MRQFISFTQAGEDTAIHYLAKYGWKTELAIDSYFQSPDPQYRQNVDKKKIDTLYNKYKGKKVYFIICPESRRTYIATVSKILFFSD